MQHDAARSRLLVFFLLTNLVTLAGACSSQPAKAPPGLRTYQLKGRVESIDFERQRVTISHEEIKDYMDAMTMSFAVKDPAILRDLKSGDQVEARLVVDQEKNMSWVEGVRVESKK